MSSVESCPIEHFLLDLAKGSLHVSIQLMWMLENYMYDFKIASRNANLYLRAAKFLVELQRAVLRHEYPEASFQQTHKVLMRASECLDFAGGGSGYLRTGPPIVAFGTMMMAFGSPEIARVMQPLISMQAKKADPLDKFHAMNSHKSLLFSLDSPNIQNASGPRKSSASSTLSSPAFTEVSLTSNPSLSVLNAPATSQASDRSGPSLEELSKGKAFSLKRYISKTAKSLLAPSVKLSPSSSGLESLSKRQQASKLPPILFPSIPFYYFGEMQFVNSLISISIRLKSHPSGERLKALHAELCLIEHNLPAPICIHSWCGGDGNNGEDGKNAKTLDHHRILSVLPYESSILNSAERVPYIIFVEAVSGLSEEEFSDLITQKSARATDNSANAAFNLSNSSTSSIRSQDAFELKCVNSISCDFVGDTNEGGLSHSLSEDQIATASGLVDVGERMRTAAVMLAQLAGQSQVPGADLRTVGTIRSRIIGEMESLEKDRLVDALQSNQRRMSRSASFATITATAAAVEYSPTLKYDRPVLNRNDPSAAIFQEDWDSRKLRLFRNSAYSHLPGWEVISVIVKPSTDMRQEHLAYQMTSEFSRIFQESGLPIFLRPFKVLVASNGGGLIETVKNAISIHSIKKGILMSLGRNEFVQEDLSLKGYFIRTYGTTDSEAYIEAVDKFVNSLVGYSLLTYTLQVRDRHNGNILLDRQGHMIHIDFGFMLSNSPGYVGFESAPFKLTADYLDLLDGIGGERWWRFKELFCRGLLALRKHSDRLITLLELMMKNSNYPCFYAGETALLQFKERLHLTLTDPQIDVLVDRLMATSALNVFTRLYDNYQYYTNGVL